MRRKGMVDQHNELDEAHTLELLDRYLLGGRQEERGLGEASAYLALSPQEQARADALQKLWQIPHHDVWSIDDRIQELHRRLNLGPVDEACGFPTAQHQLSGRSVPASIPVVNQTETARSWGFRKVVGYRGAAAVVSALLLALGIRMAWAPSTNRNVLNTATGSLYTTANGQRATVTLADGTRVLLNVGSRLDVPTNYGITTRELRLSGEAHFSVKQSQGVPLTVTAGSGTAKVLGTEFVVRHYATDTATIIAVHEGKVAVQSTVLTANQEVFVRGSSLTEVQTANANRFSFAKGQLILDGGPLRDAIPELNRWYNVDIRLGDLALGNERLAWKSPDGSISDLVSILELAMPVRVERSGRTITLYPR